MAAKHNIGIMIPSAYFEDTPAPKELLDHFHAAEELGFHSLWAMERFSHQDASVLHPFTTLAWAAGATSRMELGTAVALATLRHPVVLAKTAATLDYISEGRLTLGISLGGRPEDFAALGVPIQQRPRRLEETITILRSLWGGQEVSFQGRHFTVEGRFSGPRPASPGGIPILLGGNAEPLYKRVATMADGWLPGAISTWMPSQFQEGWEKIQGYAREAGRDPSELAGDMLVYFSLDDTAEKARKPLDEFIPRYYGGRFDTEKCIYGSPSECAEQLQGFFDAGVRTMILHVLQPSIRLLERIQREVVPLLR